MSPPRVLLVHPPNGRDRLVDALENAGCRVDTETRATTALSAVATTEFDCLVSEFELAGDDGLTLRSAVRQIRPDLPFFLFTNAEDYTVADDSELARHRYLRKNGEQSVSRLVSEVLSCEHSSADLQPKQDISGHEPEADELVHAMEEAPIGISLSDPSLTDYPLVYVNETWKEVTGYEAPEVLGRNPRLLQGPETDPETVNKLSEAIAAEEPVNLEIRNYRKDGTPFWNEVTIAPIHDDDGELVHYVGFQIDVTARREAEELAEERAKKLAEERQTLSRVLSRVNGLLSDVSGVLVESSDRRLIEHKVCEKIAAEPGYTAGWIGRLSADETALELSASSGLEEHHPTTIPQSSLPSAIGEAAETDALQQCSAESAGDSPLAPAKMGARRLLVVPLCYAERRFGLLGVYATDPDALDHREQQVFESLGNMIANGLHSVETTRILTTDEVTELQIELRDPSFHLAEIAARLGGPIEHIGTTKSDSGDCAFYLTTGSSGADPESLLSLPYVTAARTVSKTETEHTCSVTMSSAQPYEALADHGAIVTHTSATAEGASLTIEVPPEHDVRSLLDVLRTRYDQVELRARTERSRRTQRLNEFTAEVDDRLTQRQRGALEAAQLNGYFEWPRPVDGEEIADTMDITRQTFHQHLRAAERKLVSAYIES